MDEEEKAILEEEREAVIVESWRFLDEHAMECKRHSAALLEEIAQQLRCVKHEKDDKGEVTVVDKAAMVFLESEERAVVGSLRLSECHVQDFDLSIRFPRYNKGASAHYTIAPKTSYLLRQIQDAVHLMERAEDLIRQLPGPQTRSSAENGAAAHGNADGGLKNPAEQLLRVAKVAPPHLCLLACTALSRSIFGLPPQTWRRGSQHTRVRWGRCARRCCGCCTRRRPPSRTGAHGALFPDVGAMDPGSTDGAGAHAGASVDATELGQSRPMCDAMCATERAEEPWEWGRWY
eukprot:651112-Rhodomonas_salina.2